MAEKFIKGHYLQWGRTVGFSLGFNFSKYNVGIDIGFWYIGLEFR